MRSSTLGTPSHDPGAVKTMTHGYRLLLFLLLTIALVVVLLAPVESGKAQASTDDCQDCLTTCQNERQFCLENGNPPVACLAAWRACVDYCEENFCPAQ